MKVIRAEAMGLCFGVRDALEYIGAVDDPKSVTVYGELVHNEKVNNRLVQLGFRQLAEQGRDAGLPETGSVLITAHGISNTERARLEQAGRRLLDTTCPLVRRAHDAALALDAEQRLVILIGRRGHVEARGLVGDLRRSEVVESPAEVRCYDAKRIGVLCQTTTPDSIAGAVLERIYLLNPGKDIRYMDTVCRPTRERQQALAQMLPRVDVVVVVGAAHSRNTLELVDMARSRGVRAYRAQRAADLDAAWFEGCETVGLTAGTSALDETIDEIYRALVAVPAARIRPPALLEHELQPQTR